jgi:hypothetical protein
MCWNVHARRQAVIGSVLEYAREHPEAGLPYTQLPQVTAEFRDRDELLLALQHAWSQALRVQIEHLSIDTRRTEREVDAGEVARQGWRRTARQHGTLRRLLDDYLVECGTRMDVALHGQDDLLITAGTGRADQARGQVRGPRYFSSRVA